MKKHHDYLDNISVDPALHAKIVEGLSQKPKHTNRRHITLRYAGLAACLALILFGVWMAYGLNRQAPDNLGEAIAHKPEAMQPDMGNEIQIPNPTSPQFQQFTAISAHHIEAAPLMNTHTHPRLAATAQVARGANDFAFRLGAALVDDIGHENFVISPFSAWMPLAALVNATTNPHKPALLEAIGAVGISPEHVNQAASRMLFDLTNEWARQQEWMAGYDSNPLSIVNAIFVDHNFTLRQDFAQTFMDYFRGEMIRADFQNPIAVEEVNQWASDNTNGRITQVVEEFDEDTLAAIANAIYFSGRWTYQFDPEETKRDIFHSPTGDSYAYFMQMEWQATRYFEDERVQAINLPIDGGSGMTIILPKDNDAAGLLASMTSEYFNSMHDDAVFAEGRLLLPRFTIENTHGSLKETLIAMGVPLFDPDTAPLTGGLIYNDLPAWAGNAVQVAMIDVDEKGTTAAAVSVTVIEVRSGFAPLPGVTFEMICNRPFVFVLHSPTTDGGRQVLFTGVVNQP